MFTVISKSRDSANVVDLTPKIIDLDFANRSPDELDVQLAQRAVAVHQPQEWQHGTFCANCHAPFPCRLARWGRRALTYAGYSESAITTLIADYRRTGRPLGKEPA
jgi:hypothetical protein